MYLPPDTNCLLSVADHCLRSRDYVNVIVAGKQPQHDWLTMDEALDHCTRGLGIWTFASNDTGAVPDVVMACCGDIPTLETLAAVKLLREELPDLKVRVVNVVDLMRLQPDTEHPHGLTDTEFDTLFTADRPMIFAFHGYPLLIHRLTYRRPITPISMYGGTRKKERRQRHSTWSCSTTSTASISLSMCSTECPASSSVGHIAPEDGRRPARGPTLRPGARRGSA